MTSKTKTWLYSLSFAILAIIAMEPAQLNMFRVDMATRTPGAMVELDAWNDVPRHATGGAREVIVAKREAAGALPPDKASGGVRDDTPVASDGLTGNTPESGDAPAAEPASQRRSTEEAKTILSPVERAERLRRQAYQEADNLLRR